MNLVIYNIKIKKQYLLCQTIKIPKQYQINIYNLIYNKLFLKFKNQINKKYKLIIINIHN